MARAAARTLVVGSRGSRLALVQAELTIAALCHRHPGYTASVRVISTVGDRSQAAGTPLQQIAGEGVFVKELEQALLDGAIDVAVHSLKDMTGAHDPGLATPAVLPREDPRDTLVSRNGDPLAALPPGARVGTSSPRRAAQLGALRPDLRFEPIRGNVDSRIRKVDAGEYDAVILAAAGLRRLGLDHRITEYFSPDLCLPDPGQGALAIQTRASDPDLVELLRTLNHVPTWAAVTAERALLRALGGGCKAPVAALGEVDGNELTLRGLVASADGSSIVRASARGWMDDPEALGLRVAAELQAHGVGALLGAPDL